MIDFNILLNLEWQDYCKFRNITIQNNKLYMNCYEFDLINCKIFDISCKKNKYTAYIILDKYKNENYFCSITYKYDNIFSNAVDYWENKKLEKLKNKVNKEFNI